MSASSDRPISISPQSAIVLMGIYIAVHLFNQVEVHAAAEASLATGGEGMVTLQPVQWSDGQITLGRDWVAQRSCHGDRVAVRLDDRLLELAPTDLVRVEIPESAIREFNGDGWIRLGEDVGCSANPIAGKQIEAKLQPGQGQRLILWRDHTVAPSNEGLVRRLNAVRNNADCRVEGEMRRCPLDPIGANQIEIVFGEARARMASGLPSHAICWTGQARHSCEVSDVRPDGIGYRAILGTAPSAGALIQAETTAQRWIDQHVITQEAQPAGIPL